MRLRRVLGFLAPIALVVLVAPASAALAHGDERLLDGSFLLDPGETIAIDGSVHYHRLVARFTADGPIAVTLVDLESDTVVFALPDSPSVTVNHLVACGDAAWTPHRLLLENRGTDAVSGTARASLVHDDVAVMVHRAESGTAESVLIMGGIWLAVLWRARRNPTRVAGSKATASFAVLAGAVLVLSVFGSVRYGRGGIPALIGALSDLPVIPINPIVSRSSLLLGVVMVGWAIAAMRWMKARSTMADVPWATLGAAILASVILVGGLAASTYGAGGMPLALALASILPLMLGTSGALDRRTEAAPSRSEAA